MSIQRAFQPTARRLTSHGSANIRAPLARTKREHSITGHHPHPNPFAHLTSTYTSTLKALDHIPTSAVYRQATETTTQDRLAWVTKYKGEAESVDNKDHFESVIEKAEAELGQGFIEEVVDQAESELSLVLKMIETKPWEELEIASPPGQWDFFDVHPSTSHPKD